MSAKLITTRSGEIWGDVLGGFVWHVDSALRIGDKPDLRERFDTRAWAMVCARQRLAEGYASVVVSRIVATSIMDDGL